MTGKANLGEVNSSYISLGQVRSGKIINCGYVRLCYVRSV